MALTRRRLLTAHPSTDPGLTRRRSGKGFRYVRAKSLVIPPGWSDVWIALEPRAHIQAVGTDEAGRRQYLYHPR